MKPIFFLVTIILGCHGNSVRKSVPSNSSSPSTFSSPSFNPRVVTDLEIIYGAYGVSVQFVYNETSRNDASFGSVPGCPRSIDGIPWIYYGNPPRCYLSGHTGPCAFGEKLLHQDDSPYGICICECLVDNVHLLLHEGRDRYLFCKKEKSEAAVNGQIYDKRNGKCYNVFEEGVDICTPGTVITDWSRQNVTCMPICNYRSEEGLSLSKKGMCKDKPFSVLGTLPAAQKEGDCEEKEHYSDTLKKCIKQFGGSFNKK